ncbi:mitochondrial fission factor-like isoform X2 [Clavelina lepadiformis]|uniref:mitochondrial fission factor-like isoform X2 n=1 Tax=Clavelina lepadiformis TaxID=159417 RepID=UPI0040433546
MDIPSSTPELDNDPAVLQQLAYNSDFTENISNQMRVPDTLTVGSTETVGDGQINYNNSWGNPALKMEVPDRIVVSVGEQGVEYSEGKDLPSPTYPRRDFDQIPVSLRTPPRTLTLHDRNLEVMDVGNKTPDKNDDDENRTATLIRKSSLEYDAGTYVIGQAASAGESALNSRSMLENLQNESKKFYRDVITKLKRLSHSDGMDESECDERNAASEQLGLVEHSSSEELDDVAVMRKQIFKMHRRIAVLEKDHEARVRRDYCIYGITIAFWLVNGWFLYNHRRLY